MAVALDFCPDAPEFLRDPFPLFHRLREDDPVHWSPRLKSWVLTRYDGPSGAQVRVVKVAQELRGKNLKPGERVFLMLNAANRDPEAYDDPDRLDLRRKEVPHLTFGFGLHICLGFPLARMEGQVTLPAVLRHWRRIELALPEERLEWLNSMVFRGVTSLPLRTSR